MTGIAIILIVWILFLTLKAILHFIHKANPASSPFTKKILDAILLAIAITITIFEATYSLWEYVMQPPDISPYNYEEVYEHPIEIEMRVHGTLLPKKIPLFEIYYTVDGSDPSDSESAVKYDGPFYIEESTSFSARCRVLGLLWGDLCSPSPYYRITSEAEYFIEVERVIIQGITSMRVGDSAAMHATVLPEDATDKKVYWSSSDPSIASVDRQSGVVRAVSASENPVVITAKANSGQIFDSIKLTVTPAPDDTGDQSSSTASSVESLPPPPPSLPKLSSIEVSPETLSLFVGNERQLEIVPYPSNATYNHVLWESQDPDIAFVSQSGCVTGISAGATWINASVDGHHAAIYAEILPDTIEVDGIDVSAESIILEAYGSSEDVDAWVLPVNATDQRLYWYSNNNEIVQILQIGNVGRLIPGSAGKTTIHVCDWSDRYEHIINVEVIEPYEPLIPPKIPEIIRDPYISVSADQSLVSEYGSVNVTFNVITPDGYSAVILEYYVYPDNYSNYTQLGDEPFFRCYQHTEFCRSIPICPADYGLPPGEYIFYASLYTYTYDNEMVFLDTDTFRIEVY